jgi:hypothetical protein
MHIVAHRCTPVHSVATYRHIAGVGHQRSMTARGSSRRLGVQSRGLILRKLLTAALLASAITMPATAAELVTNGGFEAPAGLDSGWGHTLNLTLDVLNSPAAHGGTAWARFTAADEAGTDELFQYLNTVVGQTYTYSFWLAGATTEPGAPAEFKAKIGSQVIAGFADVGNFDYFNVSGTYVATTAITLLDFQAFNSLGLFLLDDVSVTGPLAIACDSRIACEGGGGGEGGVPEPESWALMVLGFAGFGGVLRRRRRPVAA